MKKCTYCGKEYSDEMSTCPTDGQALEVLPPLVTPPPVGGSGTLSVLAKELTSIAPLRAGIVLGILYGIMGLVFAPFFLFAALAGGPKGNSETFGGAAFIIFFPVLYTIAGFIGGILGAALYNLVAKWTGGLKFRVRDAVIESP